MKVLIINFEYPPLGGGGGVATQQIAQELAERHDVHVLTSRFGDLLAEEKLSGVHVHRVTAWGRRKRSAASLVSLLSFVPMAWWRGRKLCRSTRFDVINAQFVLPSGVVGALLARLFAVPLVVSFIGGDLYDPSKRLSPHRFWLMRWFVRWVARQAQALTAISEDTRQRARTLHGVQGDIVVVPVGFWPHTIEQLSRERLGLPGQGRVLISVGRLIARKQFDQVLAVLKEIPEAFLVVVGEGAERERLEQQVEQLGARDRVLFTGFVSEERKGQLLAAADIYVSAAEHEGFGIVFLEAMAAGLPIVAVANGGQEDFLRHKHNAWLVEEGRADLLAAAVGRIWSDRDLRERMATANLHEVKAYTAASVARQFEQVLLKTKKEAV